MAVVMGFGGTWKYTLMVYKRKDFWIFRWEV